MQVRAWAGQAPGRFDDQGDIDRIHIQMFGKQRPQGDASGRETAATLFIAHSGSTVDLLIGQNAHPVPRRLMREHERAIVHIIRNVQGGYLDG